MGRRGGGGARLDEGTGDEVLVLVEARAEVEGGVVLAALVQLLHLPAEGGQEGRAAGRGSATLKRTPLVGG